MLGSKLLDVLIGLVLIYFVVSLACSAAVEMVSGLIRLRARNFRTGICNLLGEDTKTKPKWWQFGKRGEVSDSIAAFQRHPLVKSISGQKKGKLFQADAGWPSYMHARTFGTVMLDSLAPKDLPIDQQRTFGAIRSQLLCLAKPATETGNSTPETLPTATSPVQPPIEAPYTPNTHVQQILTGFVATADAHVPDNGPDSDTQRLALLRSQIEAWFEEGMDRATGWYKQKVQLGLLVAAFVATFALNIDTIRIFGTLYTDDNTRNRIVDLAQQAATQPSLATLDREAAPSGKESSPAVQPATASQPAVAAASSAEDVKQTLSKLQSLKDTGVPFGWQGWPNKDQIYSSFFLMKLGGLLLTALAVSLGAPFWFDMLNKLVNVRAAGAKPDKSDAGSVLDVLTASNDISTTDNSSPTPAIATPAVVTPAGAVVVTKPNQATILPADYWASPVRKNDIALFTPTVDYHTMTAAFMARASLLAYQKKPQLAQILSTTWGVQPADMTFVRNLEQQAFAIDFNGAVIVSFRGTEPEELNTVLADMQACLIDNPVGDGKVHCGFLGALHDLAPAESVDLNKPCTGELNEFVRSRISAQKKLFVTGHSLGAAIGTLFIAQWAKIFPEAIGGLYTFGSPRVGDLKFTIALDKLLDKKSFRFINEEDLVTRVAPRQMSYEHINVPYFLDAAGLLDKDGIGWRRFLNGVVNALNDFRKEANAQIYDHHIELYVRKLDNLASAGVKPARGGARLVFAGNAPAGQGWRWRARARRRPVANN